MTSLSSIPLVILIASLLVTPDNMSPTSDPPKIFCTSPNEYCLTPCSVKSTRECNPLVMLSGLVTTCNSSLVFRLKSGWSLDILSPKISWTPSPSSCIFNNSSLNAASCPIGTTFAPGILKSTCCTFRLSSVYSSDILKK